MIMSEVPLYGRDQVAAGLAERPERPHRRARKERGILDLIDRIVGVSQGQCPCERGGG